MSVFIVDNETYVKAFNTLLLNSDHVIKRISEAYGAEKLKEEIHKLHKANHLSYAIRYDEQLDYSPLVIRDNDFSRFGNLYQLLKSLQCINYQIELDKEKFDYDFINRVMEVVKDAIIESHSLYDEAVWG